MNNKVLRFFKNFSYTIATHVLATVISTVLILIVPKYISVEQYGYWQLYIFFTTYITYLSFGLSDGAYLRYGGYEYYKLPKQIFVSQFWLLMIFNVCINLFIIVYCSYNLSDSNKSLVILFTCLTGLLVVPRAYLTLMLQATNRIKENSLTIIIERSIYFIVVLIILFIGIKEFQYLIMADFIGKLLSFLYTIYVSRELVYGRMAAFRKSIQEVKINLSVGIKLWLANLSSMFIIGIVRISIEMNWSIIIFGRVSLALSISNMLLLFINAIGIILFPMLRRTSKQNLPSIYKLMRTIIIIPLLGLLLLYFPVKVLLSVWLPDYVDSMAYMALLFPMVIFESKTLMLINTYLKTLRKEKAMLNINIITVVMSILFTYVFVFRISQIEIAILTITVLLAFRAIISEIYLSKILKIAIKKDIILELCVTLSFISVSWFMSTLRGMLLYALIYIVYLIIKKEEILSLLVKFRTLYKR